MKIRINKNNTFSITGVEYDDYDIDNEMNCFKVGKIGTLATRRVLGRDNYHSIWLGSEDGIGGNSNHEIKRTTGWRGTTDNIEVYAHGVVEITKIEKLKRGYGFRVHYKSID